MSGLKREREGEDTTLERKKPANDHSESESDSESEWDYKLCTPTWQAVDGQRKPCQTVAYIEIGVRKLEPFERNPRTLTETGYDVQVHNNHPHRLDGEGHILTRTQLKDEIRPKVKEWLDNPDSFLCGRRMGPETLEHTVRAPGGDMTVFFKCHVIPPTAWGRKWQFHHITASANCFRAMYRYGCDGGYNVFKLDMTHFDLWWYGARDELYRKAEERVRDCMLRSFDWDYGRSVY